MKIEENGKVREMTPEENQIATEQDPEVLDPITEIQLALTELYEMKTGGNNNG